MEVNWWNLCRCILRTVYVFVINLLGVFSYITLLLILYPVKTYMPEVYWTIECHLFQAMLIVVAFWLHSGGYTILESGDSLDEIVDDEAILLVNHQSTSDVPVVMAALNRKGLVLGRVMWVMDYIFKFTTFGWVSWFHGDFFILQGRQARSDSLERLKTHLHSVYMTTYKKWVILFPEGGFLRKRRHRSQEFAKKNNLPLLQHVTLPRAGALKVIMDCLSPHKSLNGVTQGGESTEQKSLKWVIDMTVGYPGGQPYNCHGMCAGYWPKRKISVHYRVYPIHQVPTESESLKEWLYDRYQEKELFLQEFYTKQKHLDDSDLQKRCMPSINRRDVSQDDLKVVVIHIYVVCSAIFFWCYLYCPVFNILKFFMGFVF